MEKFNISGMFTVLFLLVNPLPAGQKAGGGDLRSIVSNLMRSTPVNSLRNNQPSGEKLTIPLQTSPYWTSRWYGGILGVGLVDLNSDGFAEVITVHEDERNYLYANRNGTVDTVPAWESNDVDRHVTPAFGDYDNDGDLDMAVACYYLMGGRLRLYRNDAGTLTRDPIWIAPNGGGTWCDWGDFDNDGDLDLVITDMFAYPQLYRNNNGIMEDQPVWQATDYNLDFGGAWIDVDSDGDLDLAVSGINPQEPLLRIYFNRNGALERSASWRSQRIADVAAVGLSVGDLDKDGRLDVGVACGFTDPKVNFVFKNLGDSLESNPSWQSSDASPSGAGLFGDLNADGYLDWAVNNGTFGAVYENISGTLNRTYAWRSAVSGGYGIDLGDVDRDGIRYKEDTVVASGTKKLFYLSIAPIERLIAITINGNPVPLSDYCYNIKSGWISLKNAIPPQSKVIFKYNYSSDRELLLSDHTNGVAYLFRNTTVKVDEIRNRSGNLKFVIYPNPVFSNEPIKFSYNLQFPAIVQAEIYDCTGKRMAKLFAKRLNAGFYSEKVFVQLPAGIYFLRINIDHQCMEGKIVRLK